MATMIDPDGNVDSINSTSLLKSIEFVDHPIGLVLQIRDFYRFFSVAALLVLKTS